VRAAPLALALALVLFAGAPPALAQADDVGRYLVAAARLYENLEYERALDQLNKARKLSRGPDDDAVISLYEGIILGDMGKRDASLSAFREGLLLNPEIQLPVRVAPKVQKAFEDMRTAVKKEMAPVLAKREEERQRRALRDEQQKKEQERAAQAARTPPSNDRPLEAVLTPSGPGPAPPPLVIVGPPPPTRSVPVAPLVLAGIAVAAAGTGAYFGVQSRSDVQAAGTAPWQDNTIAHLQSAQNEALLANILFAGAGAFALGAGITLLAGGGSHE
jgi:tetratricopeptide (TPR) repeat protein